MLKSNFKKLISYFLIIMMTITGNSVVHADESSNLSNQTISKEEFDKFKLDGVYGDDVTYEDILNALQMSNQSNLNSTYNPYNLSKASYTPKKGGFVVTSDSKTASGGIIGHAGIFIDSSTILHIAGSKTSSVTTLSWSSWKAGYTKQSI